MRARILLPVSSALLAACACLAIEHTGGPVPPPLTDVTISLRYVAALAREQGRHACLDSASVGSLHAPICSSAVGPSPASLAGLHELVARIDAGETDPLLVRSLCGLLIEEPELVATVLQLLGESWHRERTAERLLRALELTASPACRMALATISADRRPCEAHRRRAVTALGTLPPVVSRSALPSGPRLPSNPLIPPAIPPGWSVAEARR